MTTMYVLEYRWYNPEGEVYHAMEGVFTSKELALTYVEELESQTGWFVLHDEEVDPSASESRFTPLQFYSVKGEAIEEAPPWQGF